MTEQSRKVSIENPQAVPSRTEVHRVSTFLPRQNTSKQVREMPGATGHSARRKRSVSILKTRSGKHRALDVEVQHVSTGKGRNNSCNSRRRRHTPQTNQILSALAKYPSERRDPEPNWNLQGPRRLPRSHTPHPTKCQKAGLASEGNAGCSFALYSQMAGIRCKVYIPNDANAAKVELSRKLGAGVTKVQGTISDAGRKAAKFAETTGAYNASTFVTPFRHDGKGTMSLEICE